MSTKNTDSIEVKLQDINYVKIIMDKLAEIDDEIYVSPERIQPNERYNSITTLDLTLAIFPNKKEEAKDE